MQGSSSGDHGGREVFVDVLRIAALLVVVVGHWLTTTVVWDDASIRAENALSVIPATQWSTWLLQVMPLLFFVGGFANSRALAVHGGDALSFLRTRLTRLLTPTLVFVAAWLLVGLFAEAQTVNGPNPVARSADLAALPFWFLGLYVIVVALAPTMRRLHEKFGWRVPALLAGGAVVVDVVVHGFGFEPVGVLNYAFVWLLPHQLGFFYADAEAGWVAPRLAAGLAIAGLGGMLAVVVVAGYPVSMVGVPGEARWNTEPPSLALVALTVWLVGLALAARPRIAAWAAGRTRAVAFLNARTLTIYLWHVSALAVAAILLRPFDLANPATGSGLWWALRPLWIALPAACLAVIVWVFVRFEIHPQPERSVPRDHLRTRHAAAGLGVVSVAFGILGFGVTGFDEIASASGEAVLGFSMNPLQNLVHLAVGLVLLAVTYRRSPAPAVTAGIGAGLYVLVGSAAWSGGLDVLALNAATAWLHFAVGVIALAGLFVAVAADRRRTTPPILSAASDVGES